MHLIFELLFAIVREVDRCHFCNAQNLTTKFIRASRVSLPSNIIGSSLDGLRLALSTKSPSGLFS